MTNATLDPTLFRYLNLVDERIQALEQEIANLRSTMISTTSLKQSLVKQKESLLAVTESTAVTLHSPDEIEGEHWIHINDSVQFPELPQPSTLRGWIRNGQLEEGTHYRRVGAKKKLYVDVNQILRDWDFVCQKKQ